MYICSIVSPRGVAPPALPPCVHYHITASYYPPNAILGCLAPAVWLPLHDASFLFGESSPAWISARLSGPSRRGSAGFSVFFELGSGNLGNFKPDSPDFIDGAKNSFRESSLVVRATLNDGGEPSRHVPRVCRSCATRTRGVWLPSSPHPAAVTASSLNLVLLAGCR